MSAITIEPAFAWPILSALSIGVQCFLTGAGVGKARKRYNVPYPDMGSGRHAAKLSDEDWTQFNNVQRTHQNYVEQLSQVQAAVLLAGLFYPCLSSGLGLTYMLGRFLYTRGYRGDGPSGRIPGFILATLSYAGMIGTAVFGSLQLLNYI
ncbi:hypothetical protein IWQ62_006517 [Dispira parvispora]|uniref:Uncharacterized protein n=1 Tax=Dispira parvispora TaxID=1520584 RepID=A0A9W8DYH5_9FUNG|nr:hypothetical protein IWQ62_006517 [Dispira parvispora]